ncbi:MAG: flavodoxin family protein [Candidatus Heimdallarchaeota archaeon]
MISALILYHSLFGNTKAVAISLANGIRETGIETDCLSIDEVDITTIPDYAFLAIGGPTHMIGMSKAMKAFLKKLKTVNLQGMKGFSFDTRNHSRLNKKRWLLLENSAARRIEGKMKKMKIKIIKPRQSAIVENGREGPLESGVEETFKEIGKKLGNIIGS